MDAGWWLSAAGFAVAMSGTPGPNTAMVLASAANFGVRRTLPHMPGITAGFPLLLLAVALGAGQVLHLLPWLHEAVRWVGAAYLLYLAWRIAAAEPSLGDAGRAARPLSFLGAALFQLLNPKAWAIAVGATAAFGAGEGDDPVARSLALTSLFAAVSLPILWLWALAGAGAARVLRTPEALRWFNRAMGALLALSLVPLFL